MTPSAMEIELAYTPPLDWPYMLRYIQSRSTAGVEWVTEDSYSRTIRIGRAKGRFTVRHHKNHPCLVVTATGSAAKHIDKIGKRVRIMCDLDAPMDQIHSVLARDATLKASVKRYPGVRVPGAWSNFELLVRTIVGQQVTVRAATTIMGRIAERTGTKLDSESGDPLSHFFPSPAELAEADLAAIGMPGKRVQTLQRVARAVADGTIADLEFVANPTAIREALLALPGIGPWTVEYFALRALRDTDAWPGTDLVLKRATDRINQQHVRPSPCDTWWRPYRGYAAMILWREAAAQPR